MYLCLFIHWEYMYHICVCFDNVLMFIFTPHISEGEIMYQKHTYFQYLFNVCLCMAYTYR